MKVNAEVRQAASELAIALSRLPLEQIDEQWFAIKPAWTRRVVFDLLPKPQRTQLEQLWRERGREQRQQLAERKRYWRDRLAAVGAEQIAREYAAALGLKGKLQWVEAPKCPQTGIVYPPVLVHWQTIRF